MNKSIYIDTSKINPDLIAQLLSQLLSGSSEVITLEKFTYRYINKLELSASDNYLRSVKLSLNYLEQFFGRNKILNEISNQDIEDFIHNIKSKTPKGYRVYYRNLKAAFNFAVNNNFMSANPFLKIKLAKIQSEAPEFILKQELDKILAFVKPEELIRPIQFGFFTGCRLSEIVNLKWKDVDTNRMVMKIGGSSMKTKSRKHRVIPISKAVHKILGKSTEYNPDDFVFRKYNGSNYTGDYISKRFKRAVRESGLSDRIHFHSLRHSTASNLALQGVSILIIKELLGHTSIKTTEIYAHLNVEALSKAVNKFC